MTDPANGASAPPLARAAFDRAAHHRHDDEWLASAWSRAQVVLISPGSATPVGADGHPEFRPSTRVGGGLPRRFLGVIDDVPYFTVTTEPDGADGADAGWLTLRDVGATATDLEGALLATAIGLEQWHVKHTRCPRCGEPTVEIQAGWVRQCTKDGSHHFPRTDPAVIMLVHDGGDLALLGRGQQWGAGRFSTLAGFVEPGESLEQAVAREVFEEVGVVVRNVRYVASQPWPFPASLMLGFVAELDGDPGITLDPVEMAEAGWFSRDDIRRAADWTDDLDTPLDVDDAVRLRAIPPHFSISRFLIDRWLAGEA